MENPFLTDGYLTPAASINKLKIVDSGDIPIEILPEGCQFKNRYASELVSLEVFRKYGMNVFGYNLGCLLSVLKKGAQENQAARQDWNEKHWSYWQQIDEVFLAGGITAQPLGEELLRQIHHMFEETGYTPYRITIPEHSDLLPLIGAAKIAAGLHEYKGDALVFDFGQSYVKRGFLQTVDSDSSLKKNQIMILRKKEARHVQLDYEEGMRSREEAEKLDAYVRAVITDSCLEVYSAEKAMTADQLAPSAFAKKVLGGKQELVIVLSIANYVQKGVIAGSRGGYGKLCLVADHYESYLCSKISAVFNMPVKIILVHDGMAAAVMFNESKKNYALISLGTYMGVGFSTMAYKMSGFYYTLGS